LRRDNATYEIFISNPLIIDRREATINGIFHLKNSSSIITLLSAPQGKSFVTLAHRPGKLETGSSGFRNPNAVERILGIRRHPEEVDLKSRLFKLK